MVRRLERSRSDRMLAGVCGGLARYFDLNPVFYRVGFVVLTLLGGAGILIYLAAVLVIPEEGKEDSLAAEILGGRRERPWPVIGLGLVAVAGLVLLSRASLWPHGDLAWILILLFGASLVWGYRRRARSAQDQEAVRSTRRFFRPLPLLAVTLAVVIGAAAAVATIFDVDLRKGIGGRTYEPASAADVHRTYRLGIGDMRLDLTNVRFAVGESHVKARVGIGSLRVTVPNGVALRVNAGAQIGDVRALGHSDDGRNPRVVTSGNGVRVLVLDAKVGLGSVRVSRSLG